MTYRRKFDLPGLDLARSAAPLTLIEGEGLRCADSVWFAADMAWTGTPGSTVYYVVTAYSGDSPVGYVLRRGSLLGADIDTRAADRLTVYAYWNGDSTSVINLSNVVAVVSYGG